MTILTNEEYHKLRLDKVITPMRIEDIILQEIIKNIVNEVFQYRPIGLEIGCGNGRLICHLSNSIQMEAFEACPYAISNVLVSNFYCHRKDPFSLSNTELKQFINKYDFVIVDQLDLSGKEQDVYYSLINSILKDNGIVFVIGNSNNFSYLKEVEGCYENHYLMMKLDKLFKNPKINESLELDYSKYHTISILQKGYDKMNHVQSNILESFESISEPETVEELLDQGNAIILDEEIIRKCKRKDDLKPFFEALEKESLFDTSLPLKELKAILIDSVKI